LEQPVVEIKATASRVLFAARQVYIALLRQALSGRFRSKSFHVRFEVEVLFPPFRLTVYLFQTQTLLNFKHLSLLKGG